MPLQYPRAMKTLIGIIVTPPVLLVGSPAPTQEAGLARAAPVRPELEGQAPVIVSAGQAFVEPPHVKMTGYNRSGTEALRLVIFYVSDPDSPFLDPIR